MQPAAGMYEPGSCSLSRVELRAAGVEPLNKRGDFPRRAKELTCRSCILSQQPPRSSWGSSRMSKVPNTSHFGPFCKDCSYILGKRHSVESAATWKCVHPSNIQTAEKDPLTGNEVYTYYNSTCYEARKPTGLCQPQGVLFKSYEPIYPPIVVSSRPDRLITRADNLLGELGQ